MRRALRHLGWSDVGLTSVPLGWYLATSDLPTVPVCTGSPDPPVFWGFVVIVIFTAIGYIIRHLFDTLFDTQVTGPAYSSPDRGTYVRFH